MSDPRNDPRNYQRVAHGGSEATRVRDVAWTVMAADVPADLQDIIREHLGQALDMLLDTWLDMADGIDDATADRIADLDISVRVDA